MSRLLPIFVVLLTLFGSQALALGQIDVYSVATKGGDEFVDVYRTFGDDAREGCKLTISPLTKRLDGRFSDLESDILEHASPGIFNDDGRLDKLLAAGRD